MQNYKKSGKYIGGESCNLLNVYVLTCTVVMAALEHKVWSVYKFKSVYFVNINLFNPHI